MNKKALVSVINDLVTDQRVNRTCVTLTEQGYEVLLIGRKLKNSLPLQARTYKTKRMRLIFEKGFCFYLEYNIRLFFVLLTNKTTLLVANDLDTLLPNYLVAKIKKKQLIYDTHELFCEVPELQQHLLKRKIWKTLEQFIFPKLKLVITVNESIAAIYSKEYGVPIQVVRNIPLGKAPAVTEMKSRMDLGLPLDKKIIILQGAGINVNRGAEEAIQAMQYLQQMVLYIIGGGDVIESLKKLTRELQLESKVIFIAKLPFDALMDYTRNADLGLTLDKATNINYQYSLPNKLFDYINAGIPVLASPLIEIKNIIEQYEIGNFINSHDPEHIAAAITDIFATPERYKQWKANTANAAAALNWQTERQTLIAVIAAAK